MELKSEKIGDICMSMKLLIEPYGIEISLIDHPVGKVLAFNRTLWNWNHTKQLFPNPRSASFNRTLWNWNSQSPLKPISPGSLLIEPYGIEISCRRWTYPHSFSFNRTLWNWNRNIPYSSFLWGYLLIEPYGIEIKLK